MIRKVGTGGQSPGEVAIWDLETGRRQWRASSTREPSMPSPSAPTAASWQSAAAGGACALLDLADGRAPEGAAAGRRKRLRPGILPRGRALAIASDRALVVWSPEADRSDSRSPIQTSWYRPRVAVPSRWPAPARCRAAR